MAEIVNGVKGEMKKLGDICDINSDTTNPLEQPNKEFTYIDIDAVENGTGVFSVNKKIIGKNAPSRARRIAKADSVIISTVRPNLKGFLYLKKEIPESIFSTGFAILNSKDSQQLIAILLYYCFMFSDNLMTQMEKAMPRGQYPSINKTDIENFQIPVPPLSEQERIVKEIEKLEQKIAEAKIVMDACAGKKQAILQQYLQ